MGFALKGFLTRLAAPLRGDEEEQKREKPRLGKSPKKTNTAERKD